MKIYSHVPPTRFLIERSKHLAAGEFLHKSVLRSEIDIRASLRLNFHKWLRQAEPRGTISKNCQISDFNHRFAAYHRSIHWRFHGNARNPDLIFHLKAWLLLSILAVFR